MPALAPDTGPWVELTTTMLSDGPWCGRTPWRFDADLFRLRLLRVTLGLDASDIAEGACWVSTGMEQLLIPLVSGDALERAAPVPAIAARWANDRGMIKLYCFVEGDTPEMPVRFFFGKQAAIAEDPGTGSACANLGGWHLLRGGPLPWSRVLQQGDRLGRACRLHLDVDAAGAIRVGGRVVDLGAGVLRVGTA